MHGAGQSAHHGIIVIIIIIIICHPLHMLKEESILDRNDVIGYNISWKFSDHEALSLPHTSRLVAALRKFLSVLRILRILLLLYPLPHVACRVTETRQLTSKVNTAKDVRGHRSVERHLGVSLLALRSSFPIVRKPDPF